MRRHAELLCELMGEHRGMRDMRKHMAWYLKGFPVGGELRAVVRHRGDAGRARRAAAAARPRRAVPGPASSAPPVAGRAAPATRWSCPRAGSTTPTASAPTWPRPSSASPAARRPVYPARTSVAQRRVVDAGRISALRHRLSGLPTGDCPLPTESAPSPHACPEEKGPSEGRTGNVRRLPTPVRVRLGPAALGSQRDQGRERGADGDRRRALRSVTSRSSANAAARPSIV